MDGFCGLGHQTQIQRIFIEIIIIIIIIIHVCRMCLDVCIAIMNFFVYWKRLFVKYSL